MALKANYSQLTATPGRSLGGGVEPGCRSNFGKSGANRNRFFAHGDAGWSEYNGDFQGYRPPYTWNLPYKTGAISSKQMIFGYGTLASGIGGGLNATADLTGSGVISNAAVGLIVSAVADLTGSGSITAGIIGVLQASADLGGSGSLDLSLGALANMVAGLTGTGLVTAADLRGIGNISAEISPFTELSPESLAAAVWNAVATEFNLASSMGEKLNDAGSAGNPWAALLADNVDPDTFGEFVQKLLTTGKFVALK